MATKGKKKDDVVQLMEVDELELPEIGTSYQVIDALQEFGVNAADITKLKDAGFGTVGQLFQVANKHLLAVKGISEAKLDKIFGAAKKVCPGKLDFVSASSIISKMDQKIHVTTGSKQLDAILGGGLESMSVTEIHGEYRCGKTQLCHTLCVTTQLPRSQGGAGGKVAFVDTEGTFRPQRVAEIATSRFGMVANEVLDNIIVARAYNHDAQMELVTNLGMLFADPDQGPFRVLIIDSVSSLFRQDFKGRGELSERQQRLNIHLSQLVKHAEEFNIAVLLVNQVMADPGAASMFGPVVRPIGGHVLAHAVHTRILMKKGRDTNRICKLVDSPCMPEAEAVINLTMGGVDDIED